jgi:regulator of RNase E activity RraA
LGIPIIYAATSIDEVAWATNSVFLCWTLPGHCQRPHGRKLTRLGLHTLAHGDTVAGAVITVHVVSHDSDCSTTRFSRVDDSDENWIISTAAHSRAGVMR